VERPPLRVGRDRRAPLPVQAATPERQLEQALGLHLRPRPRRRVQQAVHGVHPERLSRLVGDVEVAQPREELQHDDAERVRVRLRGELAGHEEDGIHVPHGAHGPGPPPDGVLLRQRFHVHCPRRPEVAKPARVAGVEEDVAQLHVGVDDSVRAARVEVSQRGPLLSEDPNAVFPREAPGGEPAQERAVGEVLVHQGARLRAHAQQPHDVRVLQSAQNHHLRACGGSELLSPSPQKGLQFFLISLTMHVYKKMSTFIC
jgi:hypothetical protein